MQATIILTRCAGMAFADAYNTLCRIVKEFGSAFTFVDDFLVIIVSMFVHTHSTSWSWSLQLNVVSVVIAKIHDDIEQIFFNRLPFKTSDMSRCERDILKCLSYNTMFFFSTSFILQAKTVICKAVQSQVVILHSHPLSDQPRRKRSFDCCIRDDDSTILSGSLSAGFADTTHKIIQQRVCHRNT